MKAFSMQVMCCQLHLFSTRCQSMNTERSHQCDVNTYCAQESFSDFGIKVKMLRKALGKQNDTLFVHTFLSLTQLYIFEASP